VVRLTPRSIPLVSLESLAPFRSFVQAAFGQRRKQMQRVMRSIRSISTEDATRILAETGIDPTARPEVISPKQFAALFARLTVDGQ